MDRTSAKKREGQEAPAGAGHLRQEGWDPPAHLIPCPSELSLSLAFLKPDSSVPQNKHWCRLLLSLESLERKCALSLRLLGPRQAELPEGLTGSLESWES